MAEHGGHGSHGGSSHEHHSAQNIIGEASEATTNAIRETVDKLFAEPMAKLALEGTTKTGEDLIIGLTSLGSKPNKASGGGGGHSSGHH